MKKYLIFISLVVATTSMNGQIKFYPQYSDGNDALGITYSLPKTFIKFEVEVTKVTEKAGAYAQFAEKYLGINDAVKEDRTYYELGKLKVSTIGRPDTALTYTIEVGNKSIVPSLQLTADGILCGFNLDASKQVSQKVEEKQFDSQKNNSISISSEDLLMANSTAKMAEVTALQIYRLRESRTNILTGETENVPKDGEGLKLMLKNLEDEEKELVSQFSGIKILNPDKSIIYYEPGEDAVKTILFRFSAINGIVDKDDLSGAPIYIDMKGVRTELPELTAKEIARMEKEERSGRVGMIYNIPGTANIEIYTSKAQLFKGSFQVAQFGEYKSLPLELFNENKKCEGLQTKIEFFPETGAIKEIIK